MKISKRNDLQTVRAHPEIRIANSNLNWSCLKLSIIWLDMYSIMEVNAILWSEFFAYPIWKALNVYPGFSLLQIKPMTSSKQELQKLEDPEKHIIFSNKINLLSSIFCLGQRINNGRCIPSKAGRQPFHWLCVCNGLAHILPVRQLVITWTPSNIAFSCKKKVLTQL